MLMTERKKFEWQLVPGIFSAIMCDQCKKFYKSEKKHDPSVCPIALVLTCSSCKVKGHSTLKCPNLKAWEARVPQYVEQLIPYALRIHHNIPFDQKTPIDNANPSPLPCSHKMAEANSKRMDLLRKQQDGKAVEPLESVGLWCSLCRPVLEIPEDKDGGSHTANVRATLASHNLPSSSGKENKKVLENYCAIAGIKTVYETKKNIVPIQKDDTQTVAVAVPKKNIKLKKAPAPGKA